MCQPVNTYNPWDIAFILDGLSNGLSGVAPVNKYNAADFQAVYCLARGYDMDTAFPTRHYLEKEPANKQDIADVLRLISTYTPQQTLDLITTLQTRCGNIETVAVTLGNTVTGHGTNLNALNLFANPWTKSYVLADCTTAAKDVLTTFGARLEWISGIFLLTYSFKTNSALANWVTFLDSMPGGNSTNSVYLAELAGWNTLYDQPFRVSNIMVDGKMQLQVRYGVTSDGNLAGECHGLFAYAGPRPTS